MCNVLSLSLSQGLTGFPGAPGRVGPPGPAVSFLVPEHIQK